MKGARWLDSVKVEAQLEMERLRSLENAKDQTLATAFARMIQP